MVKRRQQCNLAAIDYVLIRHVWLPAKAWLIISSKLRVNNSPNLFQINLPRLQSWLTVLAIFLLLGSVGLGWLVKSALILIGLAIFLPIIGFVGFFWWVRRNIVAADCPVCSQPLQGVSGSEIQCTNCGELLKVTQGKFQRDTPPDTIDVVAVEVSND